jgi:cobalt transporter subunit CbtA
MFKRLFAGALLAGLCAGALAALIQLTFVIPLIHESELYESGALVHFGGTESHDDGAGTAPETSGVDQDHTANDHGDAADAGPLRRGLGTLGFFLISYTGFALILIAGFALADRAGHQITARTGAIWGLCGFVAVQLAPAFGLPPELPGAQGAALEARQLWWAGCVLATAIGLGLLAYGKGPVLLAVGVVAIALPHLIGAPTAAYGGVVPPELAAHFAARALGAGAICWTLLGVVAGAIWASEA